MSDYTTSGFDSFLSRSIDDLPQATLDSQGPYSTQQRFDAAQQSGAFGDTARFGLVQIQGKQGVLAVYDKQGRQAISIGNPDDPGQLLISKGAIYVYDRDENPTIINGRLVGSKALGNATRVSDFTGSNTIAFVLPIVGEHIPLTDVTFTVPDGVTLIKITLYYGGTVSSTNDSSVPGVNALYIMDAALPETLVSAKFVSVDQGTGTSFYYISVTPGQQLHYYLAVMPPNLSSSSVPASAQRPLIFLFEIA